MNQGGRRGQLTSLVPSLSSILRDSKERGGDNHHDHLPPPMSEKESVCEREGSIRGRGERREGGREGEEGGLEGRER